MKKMIVIACAILLLTGCSSDSANESSKENTGLKIFNAETSHFDTYTSEQTDTAYVVKGRVAQEDDGNAVAVNIHAEEDAAIDVKGTLSKNSGGDTEVVYISPDGEKVKITDNASSSYDTAINVSKGDGRIVFMGSSAVYDFEIQLGLVDGISYGDC